MGKQPVEIEKRSTLFKHKHIITILMKKTTREVLLHDEDNHY